TKHYDIQCVPKKYEQVGGDWAAVRQDANGDVYLLVVDAAGKGLQAALVTHAVQSLWAESLDWPGFDPDSWLKRLNTALLRLGEKQPHMVTAGLLRLSG